VTLVAVTVTALSHVRHHGWVKRSVVMGLILLCVVVAACGGGGEGSQPTTSAVAGPDDEQAAAEFIAAWSGGDFDGMERNADRDVVDVALAFGKAEGLPTCSRQGSGQYQCIVEVSGRKRAYILVGEPGARPGRVWWVAEYHPDS